MATKVFAVLLLLFTIACGTPAKQNSTSGGGAPPSNLPQMAGSWNGGMGFTDSTGGLTGSLTFNLTEDSLGNLTGSAVSTPPYCEFTLAVSGKVYVNNSFFVADNTTAAFAGTLSNGNKAVSETVNLGSGTGCGPRSAGTFAAQLQP